MVKEFEQEESAKVWIVLDMEEGVHRGSGPEGSEECAVTAAASIADKYLQQGLPVGITAVGDIELNFEPKPGLNQSDLIMNGLAEIKARGSTPLADVLRDNENFFNRYCTLVIITPSPDVEWMGSLTQLTQKRVQAAAVLLDGESFAAEVNGKVPRTAPVGGPLPSCVVSRGEQLEEALNIEYVGKAV